METSPCCDSVAGHQIATNFCTCHDSTAVVPCTKFCSDHFIRIEMRVKRNFHRIWIAMEKPLVKRGPGPVHFGQAAMHSRQTHDVITMSILRQNDVATLFWPNNYVIITPCVRWVMGPYDRWEFPFFQGHLTVPCTTLPSGLCQDCARRLWKRLRDPITSKVVNRSCTTVWYPYQDIW